MNDRDQQNAGEGTPLVSPAWWRGTETPRWVLLIGAVATLGANYALSGLTETRTRVNENRAEQVRNLLDSMVQFQVFASAFSTELFADGKVSTETRSQLVQNINEQLGRIATAETIFPATYKKEIARYRASLLNMSDIVSRTTSIGTMKDFWSAASALTISRNSLSKELQAAV